MCRCRRSWVSVSLDVSWLYLNTELIIRVNTEFRVKRLPRFLYRSRFTEHSPFLSHNIIIIIIIQLQQQQQRLRWRWQQQQSVRTETRSRNKTIRYHTQIARQHSRQKCLNVWADAWRTLKKLCCRQTLFSSVVSSPCKIGLLCVTPCGRISGGQSINQSINHLLLKIYSKENKC